MTYLDMKALKYIFFFFFGMVTGSFKANAFKVNANLPLPMVSGDNSSLTEIQEILLKGDSLLLIGFLIWIAYIVFCFPKDTLKKL